MARSKSSVTTDHEEIRRWSEERGAVPACVRRTGGNGDIGMIRLDFPGYSGEQSLEHISWDEWFQKFDESNLALLHQDTLATGEKSNFNKLIARETAEARQEGNYRASRRRLKSGTARKARGRTATATRSSSARAKRSSGTAARGERSARTKSASSSRTKSSGASSRGREPGRAVSRSKSARGSQRASGDVTRRSGTTAGRTRGSAGSGPSTQARNTGKRSAKRNPEKVVKSARRIKKGAENIIRMERGEGSRRPSRVTKQASAKTATGRARQGAKSRSGATSRRKAA